MRDADYSLVDRKVTDLLTSRQMKDVIAEALKVSMSSLSQRVHVEVSNIAESIVNGFKGRLSDGLLRFCNDWEETNNVLEVVPEGTRLLKTIGDMKLLVVEQKPVVRTVKFECELGNGYYRLAFPYVVFLMWLKREQGRIYPRSLQVAYGRIPLKTLASSLYRPNLPNIDANFVCCVGRDAVYAPLDRIPQEDWSLSTIGNSIIEGFWGSTFNNDIHDNFYAEARSDERLRNLAAWASESEKDPLFIVNKNWQHRSTLHDVMAMAYDTSQDLKMRVGPIVDSAVTEASNALRRLIGDLSNQEAASAADRNAVSCFRNRLYDKLYEACCGILREAEKTRGGDKKKKKSKQKELLYSNSYSENDVW